MTFIPDVKQSFIPDRVQSFVPDPEVSMPANWVGRSLSAPIESYSGGEEYLKLVDLNSKGRRGFFEELLDPEMVDVPFIGSIPAIGHSLGLAKTARKLQNDEPVTDQELVDLNKYLEFQRRKGAMTLGGKVMSVIQSSMTLGAEIAGTAFLSSIFAPAGITAGSEAAVGRAGMTAARKATEKWLTKAVGKTVTKGIQRGAGLYANRKVITEGLEKTTELALQKTIGKTAAKVAGKMAKVGATFEIHALANQVLHPERTVRSMAERRLVDALRDGDESVAQSIAKGFLDMHFEYGSEFMGEFITGAIGDTARRILVKGLGKEAAEKIFKDMGKSVLLSTIAGKTAEGTPGSAMRALKTMAFDGIVGEIGEERVGDFLRGLFGVQGEAGLRNAIEQSIPDGEQWATEIIAFSAMPLLAKQIDRISGSVSADEFARNIKEIKALQRQEDTSARTITEIRADAQRWKELLDQETADAWYVGTGLDFLKYAFGEHKRGSLSGILERIGAANLREVYNQAQEANPGDPVAGVDAVARQLAWFQQVQVRGISSQEDVERFNAAVKDGKIIRERLGDHNFFATEEALSDPQYKKLIKQTGIRSIVNILNAEQARIDKLDLGTFSVPWDKLTIRQKKEFSVRWNSFSQSYTKQKYEYFQKLLRAGVEGIDLYEALPVLVRGTIRDFRKANYEVVNPDNFYEEIDGEKYYLMHMGARTSMLGDEVDISVHATPASIAEDLAEAKLKQDNGLVLFAEANNWLDSIQNEISKKKEKTKFDERILRMLSDQGQRFEFFVKAYTYHTLGHGVNADAYSRQFDEFEVPQEVEVEMIPRIGSGLIDAISLTGKETTEATGRERGERHRAVKLIMQTRPAGGTARARQLVQEGLQEAPELLGQLSSALNQDMRKVENIANVQSILDEMDRKGVTFSLSQFELAEDSIRRNPDGSVTLDFRDENIPFHFRGYADDEWYLVNENTGVRMRVPLEQGLGQEAILQAIRKFGIEPGPAPATPGIAPTAEVEKQRRRMESDEARLIAKQPRRRTPEEIEAMAETREPEGGSLRREYEQEYPTPPSLENVIPYRYKGQRYPRRREGTVYTPASTPLKPERMQSPYQRSLDDITADLDEAASYADFIGDEDAANNFREQKEAMKKGRVVDVSEIGKGIERLYAENAKANPIWLEKKLDSKTPIAKQLQSISVVGNGNMSYLAESLRQLAESEQGHKIQFFNHSFKIKDGTRKQQESLEEQRKAAQKIEDMITSGEFTHHRMALDAIFSDENPQTGEREQTQGWIGVIDNTENSLEERLGLPVQSLVNAARTGRHPMGHTVRYSRQDGSIEYLNDFAAAELDMPINEVIDMITPDGDINSLRASVFQVPASILNDIKEMPTKERDREIAKLAKQIWLWIHRNRIRRLGIAGFDQIVGEPGPFGDQRVVVPEWQGTFGNLMRTAIGNRFSVKRTLPVFSPEINKETLQDIQADMRRGGETFSLVDRTLDAMASFDNLPSRQQFTQDTRDVYSANVARALNGDEDAKAYVWRHLSKADKKAFGNLYEPTPEELPVGVAPEIQPELDLGDYTHSLEMFDSTLEQNSPIFTSGAPGLRRHLLDANRAMRVMLNDAVAKSNRWQERIGLLRTGFIPRRTDLPRDHQNHAVRILETVSAMIEDSGRIPVRKNENREIEWESVADRAREWNQYIRENDLDMPTAEQLKDEIDREYQGARARANYYARQLSENEWIRYVENYINHHYRISNDQEREDTIRWIKEEAKRSKERRIPTYERAAEERGLMPITMNAARLYEMWNRDVWGALKNKQFVSMASVTRDITGAPMIIPVKSPDAEADSLISDETLRQHGKYLAAYLGKEWDQTKDPAEQINELAKEIETNPQDHEYTRMDSPNTKSISYFWVQNGEPLRMMQLALHYGQMDNAVVRGLERFNAWSKFMGMALSGFHPFSLLESLAASFGIRAENPAFHIPSTRQNLKQIVKDMRERPERWHPWVNAGLMINVGNPDIKLGLVENDLQRMIDKTEKAKANSYTANILNPALKGLQTYKHWIDRWLWQELHPAVKLYTAEAVYNDYAAANEYFDEKQVREDIARYVNDAFGGQEWEQYAWANPFALQMLHLSLFSPDWTLSAANVAGATRLPGLNTKIHASNLSPLAKSEMLRKYWPAMTAIVLIGIPNAIQAAIYGAAGDPDEDDKPFTFMNETGKGWHIDLTPIARRLPGYVGGDTGKRRVYMRWGKQAFEVFEGWYGDTAGTLLSKSSPAFRTAFEQATGTTTSGWELPFNGEGFSGVLTAQGKFLGSRVGTVVQKFLPFSVLSILQDRPTTFVAPASRGVTFGTVSYSIQKTLEAQLDRNALPKELRTVDLSLLAADIIEAGRRNGVDVDGAFKNARSKVLSSYYSDFFHAINNSDNRQAEEVANKLLVLGAGLDSFHRAMKIRMNDRYTEAFQNRVDEIVRNVQE